MRLPLGPRLGRLACEGRTRVAVMEVAQESQPVFTRAIYHPDTDGGAVPRFRHAKG